MRRTSSQISSIPHLMRHIRHCILSCLLVLTAVAIPVPGMGASLLALDNLVVDSQAEKIHLRFGLRLEQPEPVAAVLHEGVDLWLEGTARLISKRLFLPNSILHEQTFEHVLEWNPLTQEYELTLPQKEHLVKAKELKDLLGEHWREFSLEMGEWSLLIPGQTYHMELEVTLDRRDIPVWMRRVLFFWSWEVMTPIRYELEFSVP
ncbi:DUF4390 domain-containing protein [Desulfonatronum thiodismutans]|uniref:DUF4390 domain-containing protein n=1 Tax=Desulfonatronum thiodismutans TaxID=159290 RepID=UPI001378EB80|nr:DUF4390 domain-containing protein [Desulfonatronum thiodismutans]